MSEQEAQKQLEQDEFKNMHFRMYENEFPKENEIVYVSKK